VQIGTRGIGALASLFWARILLDTMGDGLYGLFVTFVAVTTLIGLGDLGITVAVAVKVAQAVGSGDREAARKVLGNARHVLSAIVAVVAVIGASLAPWFPGWLGFTEVSGVGSLPTLFYCAVIHFGLNVIASYLASILYGTGNVTWPIIPNFVAGQLAVFAHWILATQGFQLWVQYLPYLAASGAGIWIHYRCVRLSDPDLLILKRVDAAAGGRVGLLKDGFWFYAWTLSTAIYMAADRVFINAGFGPQAVPEYHLNYKAAELAMWFIASAALASMPRITHWLSSEEKRADAIIAANRLQKAQSGLAIVAGLGYLLFNEWFMTLWLGSGFAAPLALQALFAVNLAVTAASDCSSQIAIRSGSAGMKMGGITVLSAALLNIILSFIAMKMHSMNGIALATVVAQCALSFRLAWHSATVLGVPRLVWESRVVIIPLGTVSLAAFAQVYWLGTLGGSRVALGLMFAALMLCSLWLVGIDRNFLSRELRSFVGLFSVPTTGSIVSNPPQAPIDSEFLARPPAQDVSQRRPQDPENPPLTGLGDNPKGNDDTERH
jgi:O-antigen/teichoic acid export membrane protein